MRPFRILPHKKTTPETGWFGMRFYSAGFIYRLCQDRDL